MATNILFWTLMLTVPWGIIAFVFALFSGGMFVSFFSQLLSHMKKIRFYEKLSLQLIRMSFFSMLLFIILSFLYGYFLFYYLHIPFNLVAVKNFVLKNPILKFYMGLFCAIFFVWTFIFFLKEIIKKYKVLFISLLGLSGIGCWILIYAGMCMRFEVALRGVENLFKRDVIHLLLHQDISCVLLFFTYLFLSIGCASLYGTFYLMVRRNRDDFGRDYYKFAIPACAKWVYFIAIFMVFMIGEAFFVYNGNIPSLVWILVGIAFLLSMVGLLFARKLISSPHPIRLKEIIILNPLVGIMLNVVFVMFVILKFREVFWGWMF